MEILFEALGAIAEVYMEMKLIEALCDIVICIIRFIWNCIQYLFTRKWEKHVKKRSKVTTRESAILGFTWKARKSPVKPSRTSDAPLSLYLQQLPTFICDTAAIGNSPLTPDEIKMLVSGTSVAGHRIDDVQQIIHLITGSKAVRNLINNKLFDLDQSTILALYQATTKENAVDWKMYSKGVKIIKSLPHYDAALVMFLFGMMHQFFPVGNYRVSQMMMNGWLLKHGYNAITIPPERSKEYHIAIERFYTTNNGDEMLAFLDSCYKDNTN